MRVKKALAYIIAFTAFLALSLPQGFAFEAGKAIARVF
jgi:hypothetical protein